MVKTINQMVEKGRSKLDRKRTTMESNYNSAKPDMKTSYNELPFNANMKAAYAAGIDAADYTPPDPDKWARNWVRKVT